MNVILTPLLGMLIRHGLTLLSGYLLSKGVNEAFLRDISAAINAHLGSLLGGLGVGGTGLYLSYLEKKKTGVM